MYLQQIVNHFPGKFTNNGQTSRGPCPWDKHKGKHDLVITQKENGAVLIYCQSCKMTPDENQLNEVGLKKSDLNIYKSDESYLKQPPKQNPSKESKQALDRILEACALAGVNSYTKHKYVQKKMLEAPINNLWALHRDVAQKCLDQSIAGLTGHILVVPRFLNGEIVNCELIDESEGKAKRIRIKGCKDKGAYWISKRINGGAPEHIYIGEGMATVQTAIMLKGGDSTYGVACGGIDNLNTVAQTMRDSYPEASITLLGELDSKTYVLDDRYTDAAEKIGAHVVVPEFSHSVDLGTDINDVYVHEQRVNEDGKEAVLECFENAEDYTKKTLGNVAITEELESLMMTDEEMDEFEDPEFIIDNLLVKGHMLTINAMPGGGKTSIIRNYCPEMVKAGYKVIYINSDISGPDAKKSHTHAKENGYTLLLPGSMKGDMKDGKPRSAQKIVVDVINKYTQSNDKKIKVVIIFDTLKKFTSMMDKKLASAFYVMQRNLSGRGITTINLAHANKWRNEDGRIVHEGTGDHVADVDDQLYFEHFEDCGTLYVTTGVGVRARFAHKQMSYEVTDCGWSVKKLDEVVDVVQMRKDAKDSIKEDEREEKDKNDIDNIKKYIHSLGKPPYRKMIVEHCNMVYGYNRKKTERILWAYCNENPDASAVHWRQKKIKLDSGQEAYFYYII